MALLVSIAVKENWTFVSFIRVTQALNVIFGRKYLPENKQRLWQYLNRKFFGIKKKYFCKNCKGSVREPNDEDQLPDEQEYLICTNPRCGIVVRKKRAMFSFKLSLKKQFAHFMSFDNGRDRLNYPQRREKKVPDGLEDAMDGQKYRDMQRPGQPLHSENPLQSPNNFTYKLNTDAFYISKSKTRVWPVFVRLDDLPPNLRQKHMFLAAVHVGSHDPIMNNFFDPVVTECNALSRTGVTWRRDGIEVQSRFYPTCFVMDSKARCDVLSMNPPTGYHGCTLCDHPGIWFEGAVRFPYWPLVRDYDPPARPDLPPLRRPDLRTDQGIKDDMLLATETGRVVRGVKGASALMNLNHFDLAKDIPIDDLHPIFLGAIKSHMNLLVGRGIISPASIRIINRRLKNIRTPTFITRKPNRFDKRDKYNGSEWRNFLLYYMIPCLRRRIPDGHLDHLQLLAKAVFLCSKEGVTSGELDIAEQCFKDYVRQYEVFFGLENMLFNIHVLLHAVACVRRFSTLYCQSTFGFESWNHRLMKTVTSGKGALDQIITRFLMRKFAETIEMHPLIRDSVKRHVDGVLNERRKRFVLVDGIYLLGKARRRAPTAEERRHLNRMLWNQVSVTEYRRALFENKEYRCASYTHDGERGLSDNSNIFTWGDEFGSISSILLVENGPFRTVRLLVKVYNTPNTMNIADYICNVEPGQDVSILIPFRQVRSHAVKIDTPRWNYIMPITNPYEID